MYKKALGLAFLLVTILGCKKKENKNKEIPIIGSKDSSYLYYDYAGYPIIIDSNGWRNEFNKAKWLLYCMHCDKHVRLNSNIGIKDSTTTLGELNLRYVGYQKMHDTLTLYFNFYYNDTLIYNRTTATFADMTGVRIKLSTDSIVSLASDGSMDSFWDGPGSRFRNPLQSDVINYITNNMYEIDPWFFQQAKKRGVFDKIIKEHLRNRQRSFKSNYSNQLHDSTWFVK